MAYYNTTNESGETLVDHKRKADSQEQAILNEFKRHPEYSPTDLFWLFSGKYPLTSIRRALTNLANEDKGQKYYDATKPKHLIKTNYKRVGFYGRMEYVWKLNQSHV